MINVEFCCPAGYQKEWLPLGETKDGWFLKTTGKWKIVNGRKMYIEAERFWPQDWFDRMFRFRDSRIDWYPEEDIQFSEVNDKLI